MTRRPKIRQFMVVSFATFTSLSLVALNVAQPVAAASASGSALSLPLRVNSDAQDQIYSGDYSLAVSGEKYSAEEKKVIEEKKAAVVESTKSRNLSAPSATVPDPGSAKAFAATEVANRGWGTDEYNCLVALWGRESGWRVNAANASGAYGIPQALPGSKMAAYGADWQTNFVPQILWGLSYIQGRYGSPCGAWAASNAKGWY